MEDNQLTKILLKVCESLDKNDVSYMIIGGTAVALNGYYRHSINASGEITDKPDIDIWFDSSYVNYFNILKTLKDLGQDVTVFENEQSPNPRKAFFKLEFNDFTFDLLPEIRADIKFFEANKRKETIIINDIPINYMGIDDLIIDKKATGRDKDIEDIKQLKKLKKK